MLYITCFFKKCLLICDCAGSSLPCAGFLQAWRAAAALDLGCTGFSGCGAGLSSYGARARCSSCGSNSSCSVGCGIFPDQASNPCLLHWSQQDSLRTGLRENFAEESLSSPAEPLLPCFSAVLSLKLLALALPWELSGDQLAAQCVDAEPARASGPRVSEWPFVYIF